MLWSSFFRKVWLKSIEGAVDAVFWWVENSLGLETQARDSPACLPSSPASCFQNIYLTPLAKCRGRGWRAALAGERYREDVRVWSSCKSFQLWSETPLQRHASSPPLLRDVHCFSALLSQSLCWALCVMVLGADMGPWFLSGKTEAHRSAKTCPAAFHLRL